MLSVTAKPRMCMRMVHWLRSVASDVAVKLERCWLVMSKAERTRISRRVRRITVVDYSSFPLRISSSLNWKTGSLFATKTHTTNG